MARPGTELWRAVERASDRDARASGVKEGGDGNWDVAASSEQDERAASANAQTKEGAMSFEENSESFIWTCDDCGRTASFPGYEFWHALSELKARCWRITRNRDGEWEHTCSQCSRKAPTNVKDFLARKGRA
jgi:hypothetical protein